MIFHGERREYNVEPIDIEDHRPERLGIPELHLWALADPGDKPEALLVAMGCALDELYELACAVTSRERLRTEKMFVGEWLPAQEWPTTYTEHEVELVRRFCSLVGVRSRASDDFTKPLMREFSEEGLFTEDTFRGR